MKVDYKTGDIVWILGDPTKYWYTFPALRAKSLTLAPGGLYPIGQHAVSISPDGHLLLFNNGTASAEQPTGAPAGASRSYSAVSAYTIDAAARTATEDWRFEYNQMLSSPICSSVYQMEDGTLLVDYAIVNGGSTARLVGVDADRQVVFDFEYANMGCTTSWNAQPIAFDNIIVNPG